MLDHVGFPVSDFAKSLAFYKAALAPLGIKLLKEFSLSEDGRDGYAGFGRERPQFWIGTGSVLSGRLHVAFAALDREQVQEFYDAALAAGGRDNGAPGLRPHYHANYYGGFVLDPDGHNIEAVTHLPE
ncbi:VOC family protein [Hyphomicrobium methylovorum]|uniref:VOC family protein n=1 Tax=Hyphomicrobium methylovorum TaxID=84 RepID=UPI0015E672D1